jgi:hypothetical protein
MTAGWVETRSGVYALHEAFGGLGKSGLVTIIVVSLILVVTLVWIFRETRKRD